MAEVELIQQVGGGESVCVKERFHQRVIVVSERLSDTQIINMYFSIDETQKFAKGLEPSDFQVWEIQRGAFKD